MHVIVGAAGQTGSAAMDRLLARDAPARAVVRTPEQAEAWRRRGAEAAVADVADEPALTDAFAGATAIYLFNPPAYGHPDLFARAREVHAAQIAAARRAGVGRVVALSSVGAQHATGTGNIATTHDLERQLDAYAGPVTLLRAANFMENWAWVLGPVMREGVLPSLFQPLERKLPMQSARDVGTAAADLMMEGGAPRRIVELHGPQDYAPLDAARTLAEILGRPIRAVAPPQESWPASYQAQGFPPVTVAAFCAMFRGFNEGRVAFEGGHETRRGSTTLREALARVIAAAPASAH